MTPQLIAFLTVFIIGLGAFFIGWLLTSSKWKKKHDILLAKNESIIHDNTKLSRNFKLVTDDLKRKEEMRKSDLKTIEEKDEHIGILNNKFRSAQQQIDPELINKLKVQRENEKIRADQLEEKVAVLKTKVANPITIIKKKKTKKKKKGSSKKKLLMLMDRISLPNDPQKDDLTQIIGIGPQVNEKLKDMGIINFRQITKLKKSDLSLIDKALKFFPNRVENDNWVSQAKILYNNKYGTRF